MSSDMLNRQWNSVKKMIEARTLRERVIVLSASLFLLVYTWLLLFLDPNNRDQRNFERRIQGAAGQIADLDKRFREIQGSYGDDPNAYIRSRLEELQEATLEVDAKLAELAGHLISPKEMSVLLTSILQQETSLKLINLTNLPPQALLSAEVDAMPLVGAAETKLLLSEGEQSLQVFSHGLRMEFEGSYVDTVNYLHSLEQSGSQFFWQSLDFQTLEYPNARISLNVYTLSTQRGWIGV